MSRYIALILAAAAVIDQAASLGINCRGSNLCGRASTKNAVKHITGYINGEISADRTYNNGEHIACITDGNSISTKGGFCAFLQNTKNGATGVEIEELALVLADRKDDVCGNCGSVPYTALKRLGNKNDPKDGILTFNFVSNTDNPCPTGLC
ncbi:hypothetical protein CMUS01_16333 [Colletotrichum musicola]|uniref:Killer toxin Kp4 domain-containing protein n=2 Tax=Colletotrichum orchidearum species complex TaxID=2707337 RepID=A0A8H6IPM8_9PEZI|nr:hypothetical protein CSOJ01_15948 [Colletotrichum sojae]KAF6789378.1 hypothetical protein CMUS01_16333 [Colletotrichum musicola]